MSLLRSRTSSAILDNRDRPSTSAVSKAGALQFRYPQRGPGKNPYHNPWTFEVRHAAPEDPDKKATPLTAAYYCKQVLGVDAAYRAARVRTILQSRALTHLQHFTQAHLVETICDLVKEGHWGEGDPEPASFSVNWSDVPDIYKAGLIIAVSLYQAILSRQE